MGKATPLPLYAIGLGSNRRHARYGDPRAVLMAALAALECDDMLALSAQVDAVLLVTDGTRTTAAEIAACERMFENRIPLLAVVLNRAQDRGLLNSQGFFSRLFGRS